MSQAGTVEAISIQTLGQNGQLERQLKNASCFVALEGEDNQGKRERLSMKPANLRALMQLALAWQALEESSQPW